MLGRLAKTPIYQLWPGARVRCPLVFARSLLSGYGEAPRGSRRPVPRRAHRLYYDLEVQAIVRLDELGQ